MNEEDLTRVVILNEMATSVTDGVITLRSINQEFYYMTAIKGLL